MMNEWTEKDKEQQFSYTYGLCLWEGFGIRKKSGEINHFFGGVFLVLQRENHQQWDNPPFPVSIQLSSSFPSTANDENIQCCQNYPIEDQFVGEEVRKGESSSSSSSSLLSILKGKVVIFFLSTRVYVCLRDVKVRENTFQLVVI